MPALHVSPALATNDDNASRCRCSSSTTSTATRLRRQRKLRCVKPRSSFATLAAVGAVALMASGVTAAATSPHDGTNSAPAAVATNALHLPVLTHDAGPNALAQQLQVDTDTITQFSREVGLVKRDPRPDDRDDPSGSWGQQIHPRDSDSDSDSSASSSSSSSSDSETQPSSTSDSSSLALPSPFDNTPKTAFKSPGEDDSCPNFIQSLLADSTFKSCYPLSMLIFTSTSFFQAQKSLPSIVRVLDSACAADSASCSDFMKLAAKNLVDESNCKKEIDNGQNKVVEALKGLRAYSVMYSATCLQNPESQNYCFATAVTNTSNPSDIYFYSMPYNLSLPGSSTPSCGFCTDETMGIFHAATADSSMPIAATYPEAARQVNTICGPDFVNGTALSAGRLGVVPNVNTALAATVATVVLTLGTFFL